MTRWLGILATAWACWLCPSSRAAELQDVKIAFYLPTIREANLVDVKVGLQVWAEELGKTFGYRILVSTYSDLGELKNAVDANKIHIVNATGMELAELFQPGEIQGGYAKRNFGADEGLVLVVSAASGISRFADLKGKRLVRLSNDRLAEVYLNTQCRKAFGSTCQDALTLGEEKREIQLAHAVFFGKADAALISMATLKTARDLNPQVSQKLREIGSWRTKALVFGMLTSHADDKLKAIIVNSSDEVFMTARGRQMFNLFKTDYLETVDADILNPYWELLAEQRMLAKQGKVKKK